jgi:hypothetical protein
MASSPQSHGQLHIDPEDLPHGGEHWPRVLLAMVRRRTGGFVLRRALGAGGLHRPTQGIPHGLEVVGKLRLGSTPPIVRMARRVTTRLDVSG